MDHLEEFMKNVIVKIKKRDNKMKKKMNRESWLWEMVKQLKLKVFKPNGITLDLKKIKVSVGFPVSGGAKSTGKTIGQCFARRCSKAGVNEIFINPCLDKSQVTRVAGVLVHELIHAVDDCKHGHKAPFRKMAIACGLTGKMTATTESDGLKATIKAIESKIGKYPHKMLDYEVGRKKQGTRNLKVECVNHPHDPYFVRMSKTMYDKGAPSCGVCDSKMTDNPIGAEIDKIIKASDPEWKKLNPHINKD